MNEDIKIQNGTTENEIQESTAGATINTPTESTVSSGENLGSIAAGQSEASAEASTQNNTETAKNQAKIDKRLAKAQEKAKAHASKARKKKIIITCVCVLCVLAGTVIWQMSLPRESSAAFLKSWLYTGKPTSEELERVNKYINEAYIMFNAEKYDDMIETMTKAIKLDPSNYEAYLMRGYAYTCKFDFDASLADYKKSLSLSPNNYTILEALGDFYFNTQDFKSSVEYYTKSIENSPDEEVAKEATEKRIMACMEDGRYDDAIAYCEEIYNEDNTNIVSVATLGDCYYHLADYEKALEYYTIALVNCQNKSDRANMLKVYHSMGSCYTLTEDYELAIQYLTEYISQASPVSLDAHLNRGIAYFNRKDYENAVSDLTIAIENEYELPTACLYRGLSYKTLLNYEKALNDMLVFMESSPGSSEYYIDMGNMCVSTGKSDEAKKWYEKCIDNRVNVNEASYNLGFIYSGDKAYTQAINCFTKCIENNYNKDYSIYNRGMCYYMSMNYKKAREDMVAIMESGAEEEMKTNAETIVGYIDEYFESIDTVTA